MGKRLPAGNLGSGFGKEIPARSHEFDVKSEAELGRNFRTRSHESDVKSGADLRRDFPARSHEFDVKSGADLGRDFPTRTQGIRNPECLDSKAQERRDEMQQPNQTSYTDKIASATSVVADKAVAAKNAVASKMGYSGEGGDGEVRVEGAETPSSAGGYGTKVAGMVTPVYEKVKETGASVMTKLPFSGGGTGRETETYQGQDMGVSAKGYMSEKLSPGEEDKALSEVVAEKLHLGGGENTTAPPKRGTVTQSEEVEKRLGGFTDQRSSEAMKHGEAFAEGGEGGMV
uniref:Low-temperature-induced 65 kDa protein n=1 Tax=Noccaea caerulescens TaxID=107243 RepID=A0A1J3JXL8_NOCCA